MRFIERELPGRVLSAQQLILQAITRSIRNKLVRAIPGGSFALTAYRNGLKTALVSKGRRRAMTAIMGSAPASLSDSNMSTSLLFFSRQYGGLDESSAAILAAFEPWSMSQLPPVRVNSPARIRTATVREVLIVGMINAKRRPYVDTLLRRAKVPFGDRPILRDRGIFDLENFAMRMEFGMPGAPHIPHWRGALGGGPGAYRRALMADRSLKAMLGMTLMRPGYKGHRRQWKSGFDTKVEKQALRGTRKFAKAVRKA